MADICKSGLELVREDYQKQFVDSKASFYLYSDIKKRVFQQLNDIQSLFFGEVELMETLHSPIAPDW